MSKCYTTQLGLARLGPTLSRMPTCGQSQGSQTFESDSEARRRVAQEGVQFFAAEAAMKTAVMASGLFTR